MMTLGSLFDGIGGFPLAAVHCGGVPVWASEIEPFPMRVTKLRFPDMIHVGDITKLDGAKLPPVDVICGGSPCQDLSVAGLRKGLAGERSGLFMDQVRIVKEMRAEDERRGVSDDFIRPRYLVWENVPGAFSSANGEDFRAVIEEIVHIKDSTCHVPRPDTGRWESAGAAILGDQFSLAWRVLDAQYWGVAQRRRRIFLVADFGGLTAPKILFEQERLLGDPAEGQGQGKGVTTTAGNSSADSGGSRVAEEKQVDIFAFHINKREETINLNGISGALMATTNMQMQTFVAEGMRKFESAEKEEECLCLNDQGGERMDVSVDVTATLRAGMSGHPPLVMGIQQGSAGTEETPDPALTEEAETGGNNQQILFENHGIDARYTGPHEVAPTMSARYGTGGNNVPLVSDIEMLCLNSRESFEDNKRFLKSQMEQEENPVIRRLLEQDQTHLDRIQVQMATAREFLIMLRLKDEKESDIFPYLSRIEKSLKEQSFSVKRADKEDIKRILAVYYEQNVTTEKFEDFDGERWIIPEI